MGIGDRLDDTVDKAKDKLSGAPETAGRPSESTKDAGSKQRGQRGQNAGQRPRESQQRPAGPGQPEHDPGQRPREAGSGQPGTTRGKQDRDRDRDRDRR
jgi:hypothetical protein